MEMDLERALRKAIKTGKVYTGSKRTLKALKNKEAKIVIMAENCPEEIAKAIEEYDVPVIKYKGSNMDLGAACGKPFSVLTLAVIDPGESEILNAV